MLSFRLNPLNQVYVFNDGFPICGTSLMNKS